MKTDRMVNGVILVMAVSLVWVAAAAAQLTPAQKCEKLKNLHAAKRALCTAKQRGKGIAGKPFDYAVCTTTMATKFGIVEQNAIDQGGACPTTGDAATIDARIDSVFNPDAIPAALSGVQFTDNGDGTVTDTQTGLQWEKKDDLGGIHDKDNLYSWSTFPSNVHDGTAFTTFLATLNLHTSPSGVTITNTCFAGHCDWRLPTVVELQTILLAPFSCATNPCIDPIFGPTGNFHNWTSTTAPLSAGAAWYVNFANGEVNVTGKTDPRYVRAVRRL